MKIRITLPDGSEQSYESGVTASQVASDIGQRLEREAVAAKLNGKPIDLFHKIDSGGALVILTRDCAEGLSVLRHSTAHLLAHALKELYPDCQITIGPVTEDGFYYDIDSVVQFGPPELESLEKRMREIAARNLDIHREEWTKSDAILFFKNRKENYKAEIIEDISDSRVSVYRQGDFTDLCRGPHVPNTSRLGKFKLLSVAGAYWRGDEKNKMLQRIYGTAFTTQKELDDFLATQEELKKRDHRRLATEMELFSFFPIAPAMPFYLPKGAVLHNILLEFMRAQMRAMGYEEVICPQLMSTGLWKTSGHLEHFKENMFFVGDMAENAHALKPMNCPGHILLYAATRRSYRELPVRYAEFTKVHRNERGGATHGILRVRNFSIDDGHVFCASDQIGEETAAAIQHTLRIYRTFHFNDMEIKLSTRPEKFGGQIENWNHAEAALQEALKQADLTYQILPGEGAFYGPKIEFHIRDNLKRFWQCGTIQLDFFLPERFDLNYVAQDGTRKTPVMIHRAILGSIERLIGVLIEHHAGHLPLWLCPVQVLLLSVTDDQKDYALKITEELGKNGVRAESDIRNEKLGYKIREAQLKRIPWMAVVGKQEVQTKTVSLRKHTGETMQPLDMDALMTFFKLKLIAGGDDH
jgi:threonyl-tRNA synthetase